MVVNFLTTLFRLSKIVVNQSLFRGGSRRLFFAQGLTDFYNSGSKGIGKHAGKAWLLFTAGLTALSTYNVIHRAKQMGKLANKDLIDRSEESTVI
jgi:hypothetical protein